jgi:hypothetical protein
LGATTPTPSGLYQDLQGKCDWVLRHQHHRYVWRNRPVAVLPASAAAGRPANNASAHKRSLKRSAGDKAKLQAYCEIGKLQEQMEKAEEKNDTKALDALFAKQDSLDRQVGPDTQG